MKTSIKNTVYFALIILLSFAFSQQVKSQSIIKPSEISWKSNGKSISLSDAYNKGVKNSNELGIEVFLDKSLKKKYTKEQLTFEFKWFHYYATQKSFMDSYIISYNEIADDVDTDKLFTISSKRKKVTKGWWEVLIIAKIDGKPVQLGKVSRFQIYILD